ncbi:MAG: family 43 glycosylhydrolase, partial [Cytophagales bacterium]|nr:family 43 glycosylhydrolase [Cytophagales bacterium]
MFLLTKKIAACLLGIFLSWPSAAQLSNAPGANGVTTYVNPMQPGDHPDQTLLRVGKDFYSTGSSFHFTPYVPILHSTDLVHWEVISRVVPSNWAGLVNDGTSNGIWQGALAFFNNKYWVYYSNTAGGGQYFSTSTNPTGPWSSPTKVTSPTVTGYDNSIFVDDDGTPYMLMKNGQAINRIQQVDKVTGQLTGTLMNMDWINVNNRFKWAEGPVMCKRNGRYYYIMAGDVSGGQYVLSSATLTANESSWTIHGNFFSAANSPGGFTGPNHASQPIKLDDGTWWCISHAYDNSGWRGQGRLGLLHQVIWDANGVPHGVAPSTNPVLAPNLPSSNILINLPKADYFTSSTLNLNWHFFNKSNATKYSLTASPGNLRLSPGTGTTHILQKEGGRYYSMVTKVNVNASATGNQAGLRVMNGKDNLFATLYTGFNGGKKIGFAFNGVTTEVANTLGNVVWLKIERELHNLKGFYSADGKTWTQVGGAINVATLDDYNTNWNEWVGTSMGLYATGITADFDLFMYRDGFSANKAVGYNNKYGVINATKTTGSVVTNSASGDWLMLGGVNLGQDGTQSTSLEINAASAAGGSSVEIWLDNISGTGVKIATVPISSSGGADIWKNYTANINASGQHDVYIRFIGPAGACSLNTIRFVSGNVITNVAPTVSLTSPIANSSFIAPASISLTANALDSDGSITGVSFYNGTTLLGSDAIAPYSFTWSGVNAGSYSITARATDNSGAITTSAAISITVTATTSSAPTVSLTSSSNVYTAPASIILTALAADSDGTVSNVQFYNG